MSEVAERAEPVVDMGGRCAWCGDLLEIGQDAVWLDGERGHVECAESLQATSLAP